MPEPRYKQLPLLTLKGVKTFAGMEGQGLNATLYYKGARVARIFDEGSGGEMRFYWGLSVRGERPGAPQDWMERDVRAYIVAANIPPTPYDFGGGNAGSFPYDLPSFVNEWVDQKALERKLANWKKKMVVFTIPGGKEGEYNMVAHRGNPESTKVAILKGYPGATIL